MWNTFEDKNNLYLINIENCEGAQCIKLSDLKLMWHQTIPQEELIEKFKEMNPLFEIQVDAVTSEISYLINNINKCHIINLLEKDNKIMLNLKINKSGFEISFQFELEIQTVDMFFTNFTIPLLKRIQLLQEQQLELTKLIREKDRELLEYKMEKGPILRSDLETKEFDHTVLITEKDFLSSFWEVFQKKFGVAKSELKNIASGTKTERNIKRRRKVYGSFNKINSKTTYKTEIKKEENDN